MFFLFWQLNIPNALTRRRRAKTTTYFNSNSFSVGVIFLHRLSICETLTIESCTLLGATSFTLLKSSRYSRMRFTRRSFFQ